MSEYTSKNIYCFDTSSLIDSWRRHYYPKNFEELWNRIGDLIKTGSILILEEVAKEIGNGNKDELMVWLKQYESFIVPISPEQIAIVTTIVNKYPLVSQYKKPRPYHADPFVVALGKVKKCTVVSYERGRNSNDNPRIGDLCKEYGVDYCTISDFFEREGWQFTFK